MNQNTYEVDNSCNPDSVGGVDRYVITSRGRPIIWHRSNGQAFHMTYRTQDNAIRAAHRVRTAADGIPDAVAFAKDVGG